MGKIQKITMCKENISLIWEDVKVEGSNDTHYEACENLMGSVAGCFPEQANVYAVFDYGVALGTFEGGNFRIRFGKEELQPEGDLQYSCELFPWKYLQEIRVFGEQEEVMLRRCATGFAGRKITDSGVSLGTENDEIGKSAEAAGEGEILYCIDEVQKLWGNVKCQENAGFGGEKLDHGWILLVDKRGSRIWVPALSGCRKVNQWIGLKIRKYLLFPDLTENMDEEGGGQQGLAEFIEERFIGFCCWPEEEV